MNEVEEMPRDRDAAKVRRTARRNSSYQRNPSSRLPSRLRAFAVSSLLIVAIAGCHDIGTGGTGELVVPQHTLHDIQTIEPSQFATTPPTTAPSTLPTTRATTRPM